jgi:glucan 1,3-beta-glucosidase
MSQRIQDRLRLAGIDCSSLSDEQLAAAFREVLEGGMHGLCFSPYKGDQKPGSKLSTDQIQERLNVIQPYTKWIRSFSCTEGNELIPKIAKENGLKTLVGAWLGDDDKVNQQEIENVIEIARAGHADMVAVGNEVMYRGDLEEGDLIAFIERVREALPDMPVGYVDAYYEFTDRPAITSACNIVMANCYPYWERCGIDYSQLYAKEMYRQAVKAAGGKKVIVTESGWPSAGTPLGGAEPSTRNAMTYFINAQKWSAEDDIEMFYFSSFDEGWKVGAEGDVGAFWGLWDTNGHLKY